MDMGRSGWRRVLYGHCMRWDGRSSVESIIAPTFASGQIFSFKNKRGDNKELKLGAAKIRQKSPSEICKLYEQISSRRGRTLGKILPLLIPFESDSLSCGVIRSEWGAIVVGSDISFSDLGTGLGIEIKVIGLFVVETAWSIRAVSATWIDERSQEDLREERVESVRQWWILVDRGAMRSWSSVHR